jgi:hypothetical protein
VKVILHLPRPSEAAMEPSLKQDLVITPRFYRKTGVVPVAYISTEDAKGRKEQYVLQIHAGTKQLRVEKLVEVVPVCDTDETPKEEPDGDDTPTASLSTP